MKRRIFFGVLIALLLCQRGLISERVCPPLAGWWLAGLSNAVQAAGFVQGGALMIKPGTTPVSVITGCYSFTGPVAVVSDANPVSALKIEAVSVPTGMQVGAFLINPIGSANGLTGDVISQVSASASVLPGTYSLTLRATNSQGQMAIAAVPIQVIAPANATRTIQLPPQALLEGVTYTVAALPPTEVISGVDLLFRHPREFAGQSFIGVGASVDDKPLPIIPPSVVDQPIIYRLTPTAGNSVLRFVLVDQCSNSSGTFRTVLEIPLNVVGASTGCPYPSFAAAHVADTLQNATALAAGDFNGDGRADAAVFDAATNRLKTYLGQANGTLLPTGNVAARRGGVQLATADFTGDGRLDLVLSHYDAATPLPVGERGVSVFAGAGNGTFILQRSYDVGHGYLAVGDLNQDSRPDIVITEWLGTERRLRVLLNSAAGQFNQTISPALSAPNAVGLRPVLVHLNSDNWLDVVTTGTNPLGPDPALFQFNGNGHGDFLAVPAAVQQQSGAGDWVHAADFNQDGRSDLAVSYGRNFDTQWQGNRFRLYQGTISSFSTSFFSPSQLVTADFNRDSKTDIAFNSGNVLLTGGVSTYCSMPRLLTPTNGFDQIATGDFNGDTRPDLLALNSNRTELQLFLNRLNISHTLAAVSAASFRGSTFSTNQIIAAFGVGLASAPVIAPLTPLPEVLGSTRVRLRTASGVERFAPLFFVSPGQVNFLLPGELPYGTTQLQIINNGDVVSFGSIEVQAVAPGIFAANATGTGLAAAQALRVLANGTLRYEPVARYDTVARQWVSVPIDLSNTTEPLFLVLYGTGIRSRNALSNVTATIGGTPVEVLYAGAQGALVGVDQINLRLPSALAGRGEVDVMLTVDGKAANVVRVAIR